MRRLSRQGRARRLVSCVRLIRPLRCASTTDATPGHHANADAFNRVQRGHQNFMESLDSYIVMSFIGGIKYPRAVSSGAVLCCLGSYLHQKVVSPLHPTPGTTALLSTHPRTSPHPPDVRVDNIPGLHGQDSRR